MQSRFKLNLQLGQLDWSKFSYSESAESRELGLIIYLIIYVLISIPRP